MWRKGTFCSKHWYGQLKSGVKSTENTCRGVRTGFAQELEWSGPKMTVLHLISKTGLHCVSKGNGSKNNPKSGYISSLFTSKWPFLQKCQFWPKILIRNSPDSHLFGQSYRFWQNKTENGVRRPRKLRRGQVLHHFWSPFWVPLSGQNGTKHLQK